MSDEMNKKWLDNASLFCLEARRLLIQAKKTQRAYENMQATSSASLEQGWNEAKNRGNVFQVLMQAMGHGMDLEAEQKEASFRDGQGHVWLADVISLLLSTPGIKLQSPEIMAGNIDAWCMANKQQFNIDYQARLAADLDGME